MNATSGPTGSNLSEQHDQALCLANRLRRRLGGVGSTLFTLTWVRKATPLGRPYYQLQASARRTSDSGFGSWPTPNAGPQNDGDTTWQQRRMELKAKHGNGNGFGMTLGMASQLASWPTTQSRDGTHGGGQAKRAMGETRHGSNLDDFALLASWATPTSRDHKDGGSIGTAPTNCLLGRQAWLSAWPTPRVSDIAAGRTLNKAGQRVSKSGTFGANLSDIAGLAASGLTPNGFPVQTEKPGQLDPAFSRWVMGYETEHLSCAPTETPSFLKRQQSSFQPLSKRGD